MSRIIEVIKTSKYSPYVKTTYAVNIDEITFGDIKGTHVENLLIRKVIKPAATVVTELLAARMAEGIINSNGDMKLFDDTAVDDTPPEAFTTLKLNQALLGNDFYIKVLEEALKNAREYPDGVNTGVTLDDMVEHGFIPK